jgi:ABC-2 type transport system ATP-binding protein
LLNTHQLAEAERICDRVGVMHTRLIALGTPDSLLEGSLRDGSVRDTPVRTTSIQLAVVTDAVVAAARAVRGESGAGVTVHGSTLTVPVDKPESDNPDLVRAVVAAGGEIQFVSGSAPSLEETYLKLLDSEKHSHGDGNAR